MTIHIALIIYATIFGFFKTRFYLHFIWTLWHPSDSSHTIFTRLSSASLIWTCILLSLNSFKYLPPVQKWVPEAGFKTSIFESQFSWEARLSHFEDWRSTFLLLHSWYAVNQCFSPRLRYLNEKNSLPYYQPKAEERTYYFMPFQRVLAWSETQIASSRFWTQVVDMTRQLNCVSSSYFSVNSSTQCYSSCEFVDVDECVRVYVYEGVYACMSGDMIC